MTFALVTLDPENNASRAFVLTFMLCRWPSLVVERLDDNREWYIYRSQACKTDVDDWGRCDANLDNFVHITFENGNATVEQTCLTSARLKHSFITWHKEREICRAAQST